jgi:N-methylhydantoinase A
VTDAHLVAGRLHAENFLGGEFPLDAKAAWKALELLGAPAGLDAQEAAVAMLEIASADMERALRRVSLAEGHDPRDFHLYAFGGAGGLHAVWVALRLGMRSVVLPPHAGAFSAVGMLSAPARRTLARSVLCPLPTQQERAHYFDELGVRAREELVAEGVAPGSIKMRRVLELRSEGQGGEFSIPEGPHLRERFHLEHERRFGYRREDRPVILVAARLRAEGPSSSPWRKQPVRKHEAKEFEQAMAILPESGSTGVQKVRWFRREQLAPGAVLTGPAIVAEYSGTTVVPRGWSGEIDAFGALVLRREGEQDA